LSGLVQEFFEDPGTIHEDFAAGFLKTASYKAEGGMILTRQAQGYAQGREGLRHEISSILDWT
jgi:hypothetical protein